LLPEVVAALKDHRVRQVEHRLQIADLWQDHGLVFCSGLGTPINPSNLARDFHMLCERAGVPRIRIHDVRHTYVTLALEGGANLIGLAPVGPRRAQYHQRHLRPRDRALAAAGHRHGGRPALRPADINLSS
jgi:integrase